MEILRPSIVGSVESNDILIQIEKGDGIKINLESSVKKQYGEDIEKVIIDTLKELNVKNAQITATDKGALDFTIVARMKTVIKRATKKDNIA